MIAPKKVVTIAGARPQFIKAFALSRALAAASDFDEVLIHTGQHFDDNMSGIFFDELGIPQPKYHFATPRAERASAISQMLAGIHDALEAEKPDAVIVYGDTDSTLAGALAASRQRIPLVHIEAGMRSFDRRMPEETNRIAADHLSDLLLCVTATAIENLARERITEHVHHVGDLMYDATLLATSVAERRSNILERLSVKPGGYAIATVHRAANTDELETLRRILDYIANEAKRQAVIFPVHPRTARAAAAAGLDLTDTGAVIIEPLGYLGMCKLVHHANLVLTDSGGLQKEAYFHRIPCVTLRDETEWVETIDAGWNRLWTEPEYRERHDIPDFGRGNSADEIVSCLRRYLSAEARVPQGAGFGS
ncbi:MAG: UDP-N-acetylglucosamine 2-epimerase (non-hydrolyzing) [Alphaproteobacteria bacterium]|nr:UDP-N-acetylglucosamine 2-epimerase (non-hydrolyzing) [Alphaproteobacteria bacterium]